MGDRIEAAKAYCMVVDIILTLREMRNHEPDGQVRDALTQEIQGCITLKNDLLAFALNTP